MQKQFHFGVTVTTNSDVEGKRVAEVLKQLIDAGLADAQRKIESGEGDCESAELATNLNIVSPVLTQQETSVKVKYWDAYNVEGTLDTHQIDVADQRSTSGQAFLTVGSLEGDLDDMLSATAEVNTNPLNGVDHVPCLHLHFDGDALAMSFFKIGDKILARPETNVTIEHFSQKAHNVTEHFYWIE